MRTDADKAARVGRIGSGDVAALTGHSSWRTPIDVYRSCVDGWEPEPDEQMEIGTLLEPVVLEIYRRRTGHTLWMPGQIIHPSLPFLVDTPDAVAATKDVVVAVEAKTCIGWQAAEWGDPGTDQVPPKYLIQAQWHMLHLRTEDLYGDKIQSCDLPVLIGGHEFRIYTVEWDEELAASLVKIAGDFFEKHIRPRVPPPVDATPAYATFLRDAHPIDTEPMLEATPEMEGLAACLEMARFSKTDAEALQCRYENELKALIGDAAGVIGRGWKVTWKANKNGKRSFLFKSTENQERAHV